MASFLSSLASVDPVALSVGPFSVHWYGLAYICGVALGVALSYYFAQRWGLSFTTDDLLTIILCLLVGIVVGGRLGYCVFYGGSYYWLHPLKIFALSDGGMSFHGGFIGSVLAGLVASRWVDVPFLTLIDLGAISAPIGLFLGRLTNFINEELWGRVTSLPWGVVFAGAGSLPRHPVQLYEALLEGVVLLVVMVILARRIPPPPQGTLFGWFLTLYGSFRMMTELVREPDAHLGFLAGGWLTMGMVLSIPMIICGIALLVWSKKHATMLE